MKREYIDVRGPHPVYVNGTEAIELTRFSRAITVRQARAVVKRYRQTGSLHMSAGLAREILIRAWSRAK